MLTTLVSIAIGVLLFSYLATKFADFDPAVDGTGDTMTNYKYHEFDGDVILDERKPELFSETAKKYKQADYSIVLWLGGSQQHTISEEQVDDEIAVGLANKLSAARQAKLLHVQQSYGNPSLTELLGAYLNFRQHGLPADYIVLSLTYDDLAEEGVRKYFNPTIDDELLALNEAGITSLVNEMEATANLRKAAAVERTATSDTLQESLESVLIAELEESWEPYKNRDQLQGKLVVFWKQTLARLVLGAKDRKSVRITKEEESIGLTALEALVRVARLDGTRLMIYRSPLPTTNNFSYYIQEDYQQFFEELELYCEANGISYKDFGGLVPNSDFGISGSGLPDYFHFNGNGHVLLAGEVDEWFREFDN
jgi:hypothetical protein